MQRLRNILICALLAVLIAACVYGILLMRATAVTIAAVPGEIRATRTALVTDSLALIDKHAGAVRRDLTAEVRHAIDTTAGEIQATRGAIDNRLMYFQRMADQQLNNLRNDTRDQLTGIRGDVKPLITATVDTTAKIGSAVKDGQDSWDDLYWDVKASVESVTVATAEVGRAAPKLADAAVQNGQNVAGITTDVHVVTSRLAAPKSFLGHVWDVVRVASAAAIHIF